MPIYALCQNERTRAHILISYESTFILAFQHEEWLVGVEALYLKFWAKLTQFEQQRRFSISIRSYSA